MKSLLINGDSRVMPLADCSVDAVVCDPPYGLEFMGCAWDTMRDDGKPRVRNEWGDFGTREHARHPSERGRIVAKGNRAFLRFSLEWCAEAFRALKPGGHLIAFGGTRTFHRLACAVEDVGFEIRDCLMWLYGTGFPKSKNIGDGRGTALKPAWEPIILARKPMSEGTVEANVARWGVGCLFIDAGRIAGEAWKPHLATGLAAEKVFTKGEAKAIEKNPHDGGRWPANVLLDEEAAELLDEQTGELTSGANPTRRGSPKLRNAYGEFQGQEECTPMRGADFGGASRFFYVAKASRAERNAGCDALPVRPLNWSSGEQNPGSFQAEGTDKTARNHHPTVKPAQLMRYLCRLVAPKGATVLDCFTGSGSTGMAAVWEGMQFIGIEREPDYLAIARARIAWAEANPQGGDAIDWKPRRIAKADEDEASLFSEVA